MRTALAVAGLADHRRRAGGGPESCACHGAMIDFVPPGDSAAMLAAMIEAGDPHRLADHHRGRLLHFSGDAEVRPRTPGHRRGHEELRDAEDRLRPDRRRSEAPSSGGRGALHRHVLRQHSRQRPCHGERRRRPRRGCGPRSRGLDPAQCRRFPTRWLIASLPRPPSASAGCCAIDGASRTLGRCFAKNSSNGLIEDRFCAGRPELEKVGVTFTDRRCALRTDEDPHPQRRPCRDRLSCRAARHSFRARGDGGCSDRRLPGEADEDGDHADRAAAAGRRTWKIIAS